MYLRFALRRARSGDHDHFIAADAEAARATVIAEDWWLEWPLAYLAEGRPLTVVGAGRPGAVPHPVADRRYWVAYQGGTLDRRLAASGDAVLAGTVDTAYPKHKLRIWRSR
jgi:hypothetical protein